VAVFTVTAAGAPANEVIVVVINQKVEIAVSIPRDPGFR